MEYVKTIGEIPKMYLTDTGILHHLIGVSDLENLSGNPMIGSSWESFVINQLLAVKKDQINLYFYRTHNGAEIDVVFTRDYR